jgi:hypothetical protein
MKKILSIILMLTISVSVLILNASEINAAYTGEYNYTYENTMTITFDESMTVTNASLNGYFNYEYLQNIVEFEITDESYFEQFVKDISFISSDDESFYIGIEEIQYDPDFSLGFYYDNDSGYYLDELIHWSDRTSTSTQYLDPGTYTLEYTIYFNIPEPGPYNLIADDSIFYDGYDNLENTITIDIKPTTTENFSGMDRLVIEELFNQSDIVDLQPLKDSDSESEIMSVVSLADYTETEYLTTNETIKIYQNSDQQVILDFNDALDTNDWLRIKIKVDPSETSNIPTIISNIRDTAYIYLTTSTDDNVYPIVSGDTVYITTVDNPTLLSEITALINVTDETDGDITDQLVVESDDYTANMGTVGSYDVTYSVSDTAGNERMFTITINQYDVVSPTYDNNVDTTLMLGNDETFDVNSYLSSIDFNDNYDAYGDLVIEITDGYTINKEVIGNYTVTYTATDTSGNETNVNVFLQVVDASAPIISGISTITKGNDVSITAESVISQLSAIDDVDGDISANIYVYSDPYQDTSRVGTYTVTYAVSDANSNITLYDVQFVVTDNIKPTAYIIDNTFFTVSEVDSMTTQEIIDILINTGQIDSGTLVSVVSDNYSINANEIGSYQVTLSVGGQQQDYTMNVVSADSITTVEPSNNFVMPSILVASIILIAIAFILGKKTSKRKYY